MIMSDLREVGIERVQQRVNANNICELVSRVVEIADSEGEEQPYDDLQCGQEFTHTDYSSEEETQCLQAEELPAPRLTTLQSVSLERAEQEASSSAVKKRSKRSPKGGIKSLKKQRLLTEVDASRLMKTNPVDKGQKTLDQVRLVPDDDQATFATKLRSLMQNITLLQILQALVPPLQIIETDGILETFATSTLMMAKQEAVILRAFLQALVDAVLTSRGETLFTDLPIVYTDPIWSTTRCGIATMKSVISYFGGLRQKIDNVDSSPIPV